MVVAPGNKNWVLGGCFGKAHQLVLRISKELLWTPNWRLHWESSMDGGKKESNKKKKIRWSRGKKKDLSKKTHRRGHTQTYPEGKRRMDDLTELTQEKNNKERPN